MNDGRATCTVLGGHWAGGAESAQNRLKSLRRSQSQTMFADDGVDGEATVDFRWSGFLEVPCG